jgi:hypothetical protein
MSWLGKAWKKVRSAVKKVVKAVAWVASRILKIVDLLISLIGIRPRKKMRVAILVLMKSDRSWVLDDKTIQDWFDRARGIFLSEANVELISDWPGRLIFHDGDPAPAPALNPTCGISFVFSTADDHYDEHLHTLSLASVRVYVVESLSGGDNGCAWPVITNIAVVAKSAARESMAHELGHLCGLAHRNGTPSNLMCTAAARRTGANLTNWQNSVIRSSEYATYF